MREICRESDIPSLIYERGLLPETLMVVAAVVLLVVPLTLPLRPALRA